MSNIKLDFAIQTDTKKIIKVIGVGGGGGNAVTHMFRQGIDDVSFVLCNTDAQAMNKSEVPVKICLGPNTTKGLGAGNNPAKAKEAALESENEICNMLNDGTQMAFITAGMGGGTGTGAAPVIARIAKKMGILTVGIVTIPFKFEGRPKILQALAGVEEMHQNVDALLVINNERLYDIYKDLTVTNAFAKADDTLATAAKNISEIITIEGIINLDFADVNATLKNGGIALMSDGYGEDEGRLGKAIDEAFRSPLLNNDNIFNAKKVLFNIMFGKEDEGGEELKIKEIEDYITVFMERFRRQNDDVALIWGLAYVPQLGKKIKFTLLASDFDRTDTMPESPMQPGKEDECGKEELRLYQDYLISKYYGNKLGDKLAQSAAVAILSLEEMDNDVLVKLIEDFPTYKREPSLLENERNKISVEIQKRTNELQRQRDIPHSINNF